jgi:hypothetical protein
MEPSSSSGVADSASYSAEYGKSSIGVTRMGGRRRRHRSSRAGQMMMAHMSSRAGGRRRKMRKTRKGGKARKSHRRR